MTTSPSFLFDIPDEFVNCEFKWTFSDILPMVLFVVSSLREDEDALVGVVFVTFVLPQFSFFLAPFREEEEEEEENKFGGR